MKDKKILWVILLLVLIVVVSFHTGWNASALFSKNIEQSNKGTMEKVCDKEGGDPYIYEVGWSDICGVDVHRGTCVRYGKVVGDVDYLLVEERKYDFDEIPNPNYPEYDDFGWDDEAYNRAFEEETTRWKTEVCEFLKRENSAQGEKHGN